MTVRHLLVSLSIVLIAVSAAAQDRMADDELRAWIESQGAFYLESYAAGDVDAIVDRLSDDFRYRDVSGNFVDGPVAYGALIGGYVEAGAALSAEGPHEYGYLSDDVAFSTWTWTFTGEDDAVLANGESLYLYRATPDGAMPWVMQFSAPLPIAGEE